jgi:phage tail-like protein
LKHPFDAVEDSPTFITEKEPFAQRWTSGLDAVLAPIFSCLDNIEAYLDPGLTPSDFLDWLGTWMGLIADETWPIERRRTFVSQASSLYRMRGTPKGLGEQVRIFTGGEVVVLERGGTAYSTQSGAALPGSRGYDMIVRVRVDDPSLVDAARLEALVAAAKPAHLAHKVEVVPTTVPVQTTPASALTDARSSDGSDGNPTDGQEAPPEQPA